MASSASTFVDSATAVSQQSSTSCTFAATRDDVTGVFTPNVNATLIVSDIEIGAVELKNGTDDTRAKIGALTGITSADNGLPVTDPIANAVFGTTAGAAVVTDANGTIQQYLRGLVKLLISTVTVRVANGQSFDIPQYDYIGLTYVGSGAADDDLIATQVFKSGGSGGSTVATLSYSYVGATNNIASITKS